ncbi:MAG: hypothetical protein RLY66_349 [Candidatus Parcubacteria bacterium]|jgi:hypothetical protein
MLTIILIGVIGAVISAVVGTFWYNPSLSPMGKWHMQYLGFDKLSEEEKKQKMEEAKPHMWKTYGAQILLSLLTSLFIAFVTSFSVQNGAPASSVFYYIPMIWLCFTVPMIGQNILWGTSCGSLAWKRFFSDIFSNLITFLLIAFIATLFF